MISYISMLVDLFALRCGINRGQRGATLVEYALIVAVIALVLIAAGVTIGDDIKNIFTEAQTGLQDAA